MLPNYNSCLSQIHYRVDPKENVRHVHWLFLLCSLWSASASVRWPLCAKRRPDPSGLGHLSGGKAVNLQGYKHRRHAQTQSQPSACGCAKGTSVGTQCKKSCGNIAPNQPSSLSSSERALRNPGKTELPRFHLTRIFFSFPFFFPKKKHN